MKFSAWTKARITADYCRVQVVTRHSVASLHSGSEKHQELKMKETTTGRNTRREKNIIGLERKDERSEDQKKTMRRRRWLEDDEWGS